MDNKNQQSYFIAEDHNNNQKEENINLCIFYLKNKLVLLPLPYLNSTILDMLIKLLRLMLEFR